MSQTHSQTCTRWRTHATHQGFLSMRWRQDQHYGGGVNIEWMLVSPLEDGAWLATTCFGPCSRRRKFFFFVVQILYYGKVSKINPSHIKQYLFLKQKKRKKTVGTTKQVCRRGIHTKYGYIAQIHVSMCRWVFVGAMGSTPWPSGSRQRRNRVVT